MFETGWGGTSAAVLARIRRRLANEAHLGQDRPDDYSVYSVDQYTIGYRDARGRAEIGVERGVTYEHFPSSLCWRHPDGSRTPVSANDRDIIVARI